MINRKLAALTLTALIAAPAAFAVDSSDGRAGGAYWNQPIAASTQAGAPERTPFVVGHIDSSDGRTGGAFWGVQGATNQQLAASSDRFVGTAEVKQARPYSYLEDFNN
jgi:hypothetical protein